MEKDEQKFPTLLQLYKNMAITQCIIFTNRKERVQELANQLRGQKFVVSSIHGEMEMQDRVNIMK